MLVSLMECREVTDTQEVLLNDLFKPVNQF